MEPLHDTPVGRLEREIPTRPAKDSLGQPKSRPYPETATGGILKLAIELPLEYH